MKFSPVKITLLLTGVILIWVSSNISWGKDRWRGILESDARGYYAYLPAAFIYNDLNYNFFDSIEQKKYFDEHYFYDYRVDVNSKTINKYWCGTAICEAPFFLAAHAVTKITGGDADGYSKLYNIFVNAGAVFYLLIGLYFVSRLLGLYKISEWNKVITLIGIVFATNLFYYSAIEPGMSHVYSFAMISMLLYYFKSIIKSFDQKKVYAAAALAGVIFLIRPQNILILGALPFISENKEDFLAVFSKLKTRFFVTVMAGAIFISIASIQLFIYKISCGSFFVDSYPGEKFDFTSPHIIDILFSYKKGLFLYTPFYLLCLAGLIVLFKRSKWEFYTLLCFLAVLTYILSSWHNWWYGGSFSSRVYVEYLPVFAVCFAVMLQDAQRVFRAALAAVSLLLLVICQVQIYQYRYNLIHWDSMTKEKYWDVFLKFEKN